VNRVTMRRLRLQLSQRVLERGLRPVLGGFTGRKCMGDDTIIIIIVPHEMNSE